MNRILSWSVPLCRVAGIRIQMHITFLLLLAWFWIGGNEIAGTRGALWSIIFLLSIFLCVVLHELGHSLVAQRLGVSVRDITLLPIGGVASFVSIPEDPKKEFAITVAGPLVNVVIFLVLFVGGHFAPLEIPITFWFQRLPMSIEELWGALLVINFVMVAFNIIPAFPMDGGRILRAALVRPLGYVRATEVAALIGQFIAVLFLLGSFLLIYFEKPFSLGLIIIGGLILFAADAERRLVRARALLRAATVADVMNRHYATIEPTDQLSVCMETIVRTGQEDFPVLHDGQLVGVLERRAFYEALKKTGATTPVADVMSRKFPAVAPTANLADVHLDMQSTDWHGLPVLENGVLVGWLTRENISRYFVARDPRAKNQ